MSQTVPPPQSPIAPVNGNSFADFELEPLSPAELERVARRYGPFKSPPRLSGNGAPPSPPVDSNPSNQPPSFKAVPGPALDPNTPKYREPNETIDPRLWGGNTPDNGASPNIPAPESTPLVPPSPSNEAPPKNAAPPAQAPKPAPVQPAPSQNGGPRIPAPEPYPEPEQADWPETAYDLPGTGVWPEMPEAPITPPQPNGPRSAVRDFGSRAGLAAASGLGDALSGLARAWDMIGNPGNPQGSAQRSDRLGESVLYQLGQQIKQDAQEFYQPDPRLDHTWAAKIASTIGSMDAAIATSVLGPEAALFTGAAQAGESAAEEAGAMGHPDKADQAFLLNAGLQLFLPKIPMSKGFSQVIKQAQKMGISPEAFGRLVRGELGRKMLGVAARGAASGGLNQAGQNAIAKGLSYDPERRLLQGVGEGMLLGAGTDAAMGASAHLSERRNASRRIEQVQESIDEKPPQRPRLPREVDPASDRRFLYAQGQGRGMSLKEVQTIVDQITSRWRGAPQIRVFEKSDWVNPKTGKPAAGAYDTINGDVYLNAARLEDASQVRKVLAEEVVTHHGLRRLLGEDFNSKMAQLASQLSDEKLGPVANEYLLDLKDANERLLAVEEYIGKEAQKATEIPLWQQYFTAIKDAFMRLFGVKPTDGEIEHLLKQSREHLKNYAAEKSLPVARLLQDLSSRDDSFRYAKNIREAKTPEEIAKVFSLPGSDLKAEWINKWRLRFHVIQERRQGNDKSGFLDITVEPGKVLFHSLDLNSLGKRDGGGSQAYQTAYAYAHQNGLIAESGVLTPVNELRTTSNMLSSALRFQTTRHMRPSSQQNIKWNADDTPQAYRSNILALAREESVRVMRAFPELQDLTFDFEHGAVRNRSGKIYTPIELTKIIEKTDREYKKGVGEGTATRAIMTRAALDHAAHGQSFTGRKDHEIYKSLLYSHAAYE